MKNTLWYLWQLPQNLFGLALWAKLRRERKVKAVIRSRDVAPADLTAKTTYHFDLLRLA